MNVTIIGSFRKYYDEICAVIELFERNGIKVLSPKASVIVNDLNGFVLLKSDNTSFMPHEIQQRVFDNIERSDYVYVWNPEGYIGLTTAYEIGYVTHRNINIYFKEDVKDLPIEISEDKIMSPERFVTFVNHRMLVMRA